MLIFIYLFILFFFHDLYSVCITISYLQINLSYWTKIITQLINGPISVWLCGVGQSIWDILLNYSQRMFGAQGVAPLQYDSLSSNLIGQNAFVGPRHMQRGWKFKRFPYPLLQRYVNKMKVVAWKSFA